MRRAGLLKSLILTACLCGGTASAWAGPSTFTVYGVSQQPNADPVQIDSPISAATWAGPILLNTSIGSLVTWCIDLYATITLGSGQHLTYQTGALSTTTTNGNGVRLTATQVQEIGGLAAYGSSLYAAHPQEADDLAAVQLAIWSVENRRFTYEGVSNAVVQLTNADIANAPNLSGGVTELVSGSGTQNLVVVTAAVPEPLSLALLGAGLAGLAAVRRGRRYRAALPKM